MLIAIGNDHHGYILKQNILALVSELGHQYQDVGCFDETAVDYPDIAEKVANAVAKGEADRGVLICGSGIGMSISANKIPGARAALCTDTLLARMARQHNDANILCMGGATMGDWLALEVARTFLTSQFEGDRHTRRVNKITALERQERAATSKTS